MKTLCMLISFYHFQLDFVSHILSRSICSWMLSASISSFSRTYWCDTDFRFSNLCTDFFLPSFFSLRIWLTHFSRNRKIEKNMISAMLLIFCTIWFRPCCRDKFFSAFQISKILYCLSNSAEICFFSFLFC